MLALRIVVARHFSVRRVVGSLAAAMCVVFSCGYAPHIGASSPTLESLFGQYRTWSFDSVQQSLRDPGLDWPVLVAEAQEFAGAHAHDLAAAAFLLEVAQNHFAQGTPKSPFFEMACAVARGGPPRTPFDVAWQLAALSLAEGRNAGDDFGSAPPYTGVIRYTDVFLHLDHIAGRGLDAGALALAKGIFHEQLATNDLLVVRSFEGTPSFTPTRQGAIGRAPSPAARNANLLLVASVTREAIALFDKAAAYEDVRAEAMLRGAFLRSFLSEHGDALGVGWDDSLLDVLARVKVLTSDRRLLFLSDLFSARYLEARGRIAEAAGSYGEAHAMFPAAFSAQLGLMSTSYLLGQPASFDPSTAVPLGDSMAVDPWLSYRYGDYRLWTQRVSALRTEVQRLAGR